MSDEPEGLNEPEYELEIPKNESKDIDEETDENTPKIKDNPASGFTESGFKKVTGKSAKKVKLDKEKPKKESKAPKDYPKGKLDFEQAKRALQQNQYNIWEDPDNHYCEIKIPKLVTLGEDLVIKLSRKVKRIHYMFGDGYKWTKQDTYNPKSEFDISMRPTVELKDDNFNDDKIVIPTGEIKKINNLDYQMWLTGHYYLTVRAYNKEWHEDAVAKTMVELVEK